MGAFSLIVVINLLNRLAMLKNLLIRSCSTRAGLSLASPYYNAYTLSATVTNKRLLSGGKNDHNETNPPAIKPPEIKHFKQPVEVEGHKILDSEYSPPHPIWDDEHVRSVTRIHTKPKGLVEKTAWFIVQGFRKTFDFFSGYTFARWGWGTFDERSVLYSCARVDGGLGAPLTFPVQDEERRRMDPDPLRGVVQ